MVRYERPQKGRLRQFHQMGVELMGCKDPIGDVEVIVLAYNIIKALGLETRTCLEINTLGDTESRTIYRTHLVKYLNDFRDELSEDSKIRLSKNPLRILDSKDARDREIIQNAPKFSDHLNDLSQDFFGRVLAGLKAFNIPYHHNEKLVRGLDYYCHTAFEITTTELGAQGTLLAGGRYDGLFPLMGGPLIPSVGWAGGIERFAMMIPEVPQTRGLVMIAGVEDLLQPALGIADTLRQSGFKIELAYQTHIGKALKYANKISAIGAVILGEDEAKTGTVTFKNLDSGEQQVIEQNTLPTTLRGLL